MKWTIVPTTIATILAIGIAGVALAASAPSFEDVDANTDGKISKEEAAKVPELDFAAADVNKDGVLSRSEYESAIS